MKLSFNVRKNITFSDFIISHYYYYKHPFDVVNRYRKKFKNYIHVLIKKIKNEYPIKAMLKDGKKLILNSKFHVLITSHNLEKNISFKDDLLIIKTEKFQEVKMYDWNENGDIFAIFFEQEYQTIPVENKEVVDIGANIGDSSIYFVLRGASRVIALEPSPKNYESALKNLQLNGMLKKIDLIMAGCSNIKKTIPISTTKGGVGYSLEADQNNQIVIPVITLNDILERCKSKLPILKIDCEGCEYEIILSASNEVLQRFSFIQIEYHFGYQNLKQKLENCGFSVEITKPRIGGRLYSKKIKSYVGFLYAKKNS